MNIPNIKCIMQCQIYQLLTFALVLQHISCIGKDIKLSAVSVIFIEQRFIMSRQMKVIVEELSFTCNTVTQDY